MGLENQWCYCMSTDCMHLVPLLCNMLVARINWSMNPVSLVRLSGCSQTTVTSYITQYQYYLSQTALWYPWNLYIMILCHFQAVLICLGAHGGIVVKALCYIPAGRGFDSRRCHWNSSVTWSFWPHYGPGVDSACNRNEYQVYFLGVKAAGA